MQNREGGRFFFSTHKIFSTNDSDNIFIRSNKASGPKYIHLYKYNIIYMKESKSLHVIQKKIIR